MEPITLGIVASIASAALSAVSSFESGRQQQKVANANARMLEQEAKQKEYAANVKAGQYKKEAERRMGQMRAGYLSSGVSNTEGTPLLVLMESASEAAEDEERIRIGGELESWNLLSKANIQRTAGKNAQTAGAMGAGASLLGGAARTFQMWKGMK
jgi:hypothetical protein